MFVVWLSWFGDHLLNILLPRIEEAAN
jgi:hypothetical protein